MADKYVKIQFQADVSDLKTGLNKADNDLNSFSDSVAKWSKAAAAAFVAVTAAAAAYATKLAIDGVKSAIADEAAQVKLATTLRNVAGATDATVRSTEDYILKLSLATGKTDEELRPAMDRLARSTRDTETAQKLLTLAVDISAGSGKSLETVANALGKAYDGNTTSLGKLGIGLSSAELKSMSFDQVTKSLSDTFKNQATVQADTFEGKMARVRVALDEAKEAVGMRLLPIISTFADYLIKNVIPAVTEWIDVNGPKLVKVLTEDVIPAVTKVVSALGTIVKWVVDNREILGSIGAVILSGLAAYKITNTVTEVVGTINSLATAFKGVTAAATAAGAASAATATGVTAAGTAGAAASVGLASFAGVIATISAGIVGLVLAFKKLTEWQPFIDAVNNVTKSGVLPGLGLTGATNYDVKTSSSGTPIYTSNPQLKQGSYLAYTAPAPIVPPDTTTTSPQALAAAKQAATDAEAARLEDIITKVTLSQAKSTSASLKELMAQMTAFQKTELNFNAPVVSDPESLARLVSDALNGSANRTGNYSTLGISTTSLAPAAI